MLYGSSANTTKIKQAAVFNASGGFLRKPFLEVPEEVFATSFAVSANGGFLFSRATLPFLLKGVEYKSQHPPSLIFTGATASVKANAMMSSFATGKWALRALSQSLAKEFGPQGVHVSHVVVDGVIDIPRTKEWLKEAGPEAKLSPDGVRLLLYPCPTTYTDERRLPIVIGGSTHSQGQTSRGRLTYALRWRNGKTPVQAQDCP